MIKTTNNKKLTPASISSQKKWAGLSANRKSKLCKSLPDADKDSVPNKYDCKPNNKRRQESFLPVDEAYINSNPNIELGKKISNGLNGDVFAVAGNRNMVIKVPRGYSADSGSVTDSGKKRLIGDIERLILANSSRRSVMEEYEVYHAYDLNNKPLFIPTKVIHLGSNDLNNGTYVGLLRPKITPILDNSKSVGSHVIKNITDNQIFEIKAKLTALTKEGFVLRDGLQVGRDKAGRILLYDAGLMEKTNDIGMAFITNDRAWYLFLKKIGRANRNDLKFFGQIE
jgi:hypothetical protein